MAVEMEQEVLPAQFYAPRKMIASKAAKPKPTWATMIENAVKEMNEQGGSSVPAIKKFILANNNVETVSLTSHMRRAIKTLTVNGTLIQTKGHGLTGSFKLGALKTEAPKKVSAAATKNKKKSPKKVAAPKTEDTSAPIMVRKIGVIYAKSPERRQPKKAPKAKKPVAPKTKKPMAKKSSLSPKEKKVAAKPKVEKKVRAKPKVEKVAPSKVNKATKNPQSPKSKIVKKVAAKPKAKPAGPK